MADETHNINYHYREQGLDALNRKISLTNRYLLQATNALHAQNSILQRTRTSTTRLATAKSNLSGKMAGLALRFVGYNFILNQVMGAQQKLIQFVQESVTAYREFEMRIAEVSTILTSDAMPAVDRLKYSVVDLSIKYGQATSDLSKGLYDVLSAAFSTRDSILVLDAATKASIAGISEVRTSVDIFTTVLNAYGKAAEQAGHVSDTLFQSVIRGKFQFEDLESALGYVTPIAAQAGIAFDELMAALSTTTRHGLHLDMTARGLALAIQNIINPSNEAAKAAEKYGIEMNGLALQVEGLYGWFSELHDAVDNFGRNILAEIIPNMRSLRVAMVLAGDEGLGGFRDDLEMLAESANRTEEAMNKIMETSQFVANQLTQQFEKVKRDVGEQWDAMMLNIQRGIISIGKLFAGGIKFTPTTKKYLISDDTIENAKHYAQIMADITKEEERKTAWQEYLNSSPEKKIQSLLSQIRGVDPLGGITANIEDLANQLPNFEDAWMDVVGAIKDAQEEIGDLELTLSNIELDIEKFREHLEKPIEFGWGGFQEQYEAQHNIVGGLKGTLYYQLEVLKAEQMQADVSHDVSTGLKAEWYQYKVLDEAMQENVRIIREWETAQEKARKQAELMSEALRILQIKTLEIQLKGMMRRRGLTRTEERQLKQIQIQEAKIRLEQMKNQQSTMEASEVSVEAYQNAQEALENYTTRIEEETYQLKYSYDQQIADLTSTIESEKNKLQTRYEWWESTNQKIINSTSGLISDLNDIVREEEFSQLLKDWGIDAEALIAQMETLRQTATGQAGTYVEQKGIVLTTTPSEKYQRFEDMFPELSERIRNILPINRFQHGIERVPYTMPAIVDAGEKIIPANKVGESEQSVTFNNYINAVINNEMDARRLGELVAEGERSYLFKNGRTNFRVR